MRVSFEMCFQYQCMLKMMLQMIGELINRWNYWLIYVFPEYRSEWIGRNVLPSVYHDEATRRLSMESDSLSSNTYSGFHTFSNNNQAKTSSWFTNRQILMQIQYAKRATHEQTTTWKHTLEKLSLEERMILLIKLQWVNHQRRREDGSCKMLNPVWCDWNKLNHFRWFPKQLCETYFKTVGTIHGVCTLNLWSSNIVGRFWDDLN